MSPRKPRTVHLPLVCVLAVFLAATPLLGQVGLHTSTRPPETMPTTTRFEARMPIDNESLTEIIGYASGAKVGGVAQSSVTAPILRWHKCSGGQGWIPDTVAYLDQMIFYNNKPLTPMRSYSVPVCYDTCHRANLCVGQGGAEICDCLEPDDIPFDAHFQLYDGNPCGEGVPIAGTQVTIPVTAAEIPPETIGNGSSKCFTLTAVVDPKVEVPEEVWLEANLGHDDAWFVRGTEHSITERGDSPLNGINDGVECRTFCGDFPGTEPGGFCTFEPDGCNWLTLFADANADVIFSLQPVPPPAETKHAETFTYRIVGNEAILERGGEPVFFELRVNDFDPKQEGIVARGWQVQIDSSGYISAFRGTLTPSHPECVDSGIDCATQNGPGSLCNVPVEAIPNVCMAGFFDLQRSDYIFLGQSQAAAVNRTSLDYRFAATTPGGGGAVSRPEGYYLASLVLSVSPDASGTFTIGLAEPPRTLLFQNSGPSVPLVGSVPGKITIETGRCCVDFGDACLDDLTLNECEAHGGVLAPNSTCTDNPCPTTGACCDSLAPGGVCANGVTEADCVGDHLTFTPRTTCAAVTCNEATGACCVEGVCSNDLARSECNTDNWFKGLTCDDPGVSEPCTDKGRIPTVSAWGFAVLGLLLLAAAKIRFGRRVPGR